MRRRPILLVGGVSVSSIMWIVALFLLGAALMLGTSSCLAISKLYGGHYE